MRRTPPLRSQEPITPARWPRFFRESLSTWMGKGRRLRPAGNFSCSFEYSP
jgi:hypothetical protein